MINIHIGHHMSKKNIKAAQVAPYVKHGNHNRVHSHILYIIDKAPGTEVVDFCRSSKDQGFSVTYIPLDAN